MDNRKMGPLPADHWLVTEAQYTCPACEQRFAAGQHVTLVSIGPGADPAARRACREGRAYNAVAVSAHWACVTGIEEQQS